jgi:hypothetical protein
MRLEQVRAGGNTPDDRDRPGETVRREVRADRRPTPPIVDAALLNVHYRRPYSDEQRSAR